MTLPIEEDGQRFCLITGPNMAGKSTYLRQNALIVLLSQIGSFVPARNVELGVVDSLFCRVGASDKSCPWGVDIFGGDAGSCSYPQKCYKTIPGHR